MRLGHLGHLGERTNLAHNGSQRGFAPHLSIFALQIGGQSTAILPLKDPQQRHHIRHEKDQFITYASSPKPDIVFIGAPLGLALVVGGIEHHSAILEQDTTEFIRIPYYHGYELGAT